MPRKSQNQPKKAATPRNSSNGRLMGIKSALATTQPTLYSYGFSKSASRRDHTGGDGENDPKRRRITDRSHEIAETQFGGFTQSVGFEYAEDRACSHRYLSQTYKEKRQRPLLVVHWKSETDANALVQGMSQVETRSERTMGRDGGRKRRRGEPGWPPPKRVDSDPLCPPESHQIHHGISTTHRSGKAGG